MENQSCPLMQLKNMVMKIQFLQSRNTCIKCMIIMLSILEASYCYAQISAISVNKAVVNQKPAATDFLKTQMSAKAREKNFGNPLQGYSAPVYYAQGNMNGSVQKFERGNVYYQYYTGIHAVPQKFVPEFEATRNVDPLGFPVTDELQDGANSMQVFENAILYYYKDRGGVVVWHLKERASTTSYVSDYPKKYGYYRITLTGFTCNHPTNDDVLERDGKGDEVYISTSYFDVDRNGNTTQRANNRTKVFGDVNKPEWIAGPGSRILFGSKSAFGGIDSRNSYPGTPYSLSTAPDYPFPGRTATIPYVVYEGTLTEDENQAVVVPTVWEWDGDGEDGLNVFLRFITGAGLIDLTNYQLGVIADNANYSDNSKTQFRYLGNILYTFNNEHPGSRVTVSKNIIGDPKDRPVGMYDDGDHFSFRPIAMKLGYKDAEQLCNLNALGIGNGIFKIDYIDDPALQGNYTLYFKIEKLRGN